MAQNYDDLIARGFAEKEIPKLPVPELMRYMKGWLAQRPRGGKRETLPLASH
jgi:hypothetical protein